MAGCEPSCMLSTMYYIRWETLKKAGARHLAMQNPTIWVLQWLCVTYGTPHGHEWGPSNPL